MKEINIFSLQQCEEWDIVVNSFKKRDVYYFSGYSKAFHLHGDGDPFLVYYQDDFVRAIQVVFKRDVAKFPDFCGKIPERTFFDTVTPYGYGGFLIDGVFDKYSRDGLASLYAEFCRDAGIVSEFVRFHPLLENHILLDDMYFVVPMGSTISMDLSSFDFIWNNISGKNKNMVRKAKKNNIAVFWGRTPQLLFDFKNMYNETMIGHHASDYYFFDDSFYESVLNDLKYTSMVFSARLNGVSIASAIILFCNNFMHYHLSGTNAKFRHLAPSNLLLYEAACWGSANGYKKFHLGGGVGATEDNLFSFKKSFSMLPPHHFYVGKKIFDEKKYEFLLSFRGFCDFENKFSGFFPKYRAALDNF